MREFLNVDGEGTCIHERSAIGRAQGICRMRRDKGKERVVVVGRVVRRALESGQQDPRCQSGRPSILCENLGAHPCVPNCTLRRSLLPSLAQSPQR
jgi:hypothetical protein